MKRLALVLAGMTVLVTCGLIWCFQPPVPASKEGQLRKGMTQVEVRKILGEPTKVYPGQWTYTKPFVFGFVNIHWQSDGTYDGDFNYERF